MNQTGSEKWLYAAVSVLAVIFLAGGGLLFGRKLKAPQSAAGSSAEIAFAETTDTTAQTTTATTAKTTVTTAVSTASETTVVTTAAPEPSPETPYQEYVRDVLIPQFGLALTGESAVSAQQTGIAGVLIRDFLGTGTPDMLVIRLDVMDAGSAAVPVFFWYTMRGGQVVQADAFESKLQWSGYCIRYAEKTLYLSGEWSESLAEPENWRCTEMAVQMQNDRDMTLLNMEQGAASKRLAPMYPEDAELLTEMQLDTAEPTENLTERRYLLWDYTDAANFSQTP